MLFKILATVVLAFGAVIFSVVSVLGTRDSLRRLRRYTATKLTPVDGLSGAAGKVSGTVMPQDDKPLVRAPISGVDCVAYYLVVEGLRPQVMEDNFGRPVKTRVMKWERVFEGVVADDLLLADRTGQVVIDMAGAKELDVHHPDRVTTGDVKVSGEAWARLEEEFPEFERMPNGQYRAAEKRIEVGDTLLAAGPLERAGRRPRIVRREEADTVSTADTGGHVHGTGGQIRTRDRDKIVLTDKTDADITKRFRKYVFVSVATGVFGVAVCAFICTGFWLLF